MLMVKILNFSICFAMICILNEFSVEIGKGFVGADDVARPYKSFFYKDCDLEKKFQIPDEGASRHH
jgi:hypothetical protein